MTRKNDIDALLGHSKVELEEIRKKYETSLRENVSPVLRVDIKNFCENLRSVLEYLAQDVRDKYCPTSKGRIYFPIASSLAEFKGNMQKWFPDLDKSVPDFWKYLESIQPYNGADRIWLGQFNRLNNENKHGSLVKQMRNEIKQVKATMQTGGEVAWLPDSVRFGPGVSIGGVPVDPATQRPVPHPSLKVEEITWVDHVFEGINVSALALLSQSLQGVEGINKLVQSLL